MDLVAIDIDRDDRHGSRFDRRWNNPNWDSCPESRKRGTWGTWEFFVPSPICELLSPVRGPSRWPAPPGGHRSVVRPGGCETEKAGCSGPCQTNNLLSTSSTPPQASYARFDLNCDGVVGAADVLRVVNFLKSARAAISLHHSPLPESLSLLFDADGDDWVTPTDVLLLVNHVNAQPLGEGEASDATGCNTTGRNANVQPGAPSKSS